MERRSGRWANVAISKLLAGTHLTHDPLDFIWVSDEHAQQDIRGRVGDAAATLPISQRLQRQAETPCKHSLRQLHRAAEVLSGLDRGFHAVNIAPGTRCFNGTAYSAFFSLTCIPMGPYEMVFKEE